MTTENPYDTPSASLNSGVSFSGKFEEYDDSELNRLYRKSRDIGSIGALCIFSSFVVFALFLNITPYGMSAMYYVLIAIAVLQLVVAFGLFTRPGWGRAAGLLVCAISLINIPVGTIFGIVGILAMYPNKNLFGENRISHGELKAEYKARKAAKKAKKA